MKKPGRIALVILFVLGAIYLGYIFWQNQKPVNYAERVDDFKTQGVPEFRLPIFDGKTNLDKSLGLSETSFDIALVNFWATWCLPCKSEFPSLVELSKRYKDNPKFKIFAVSVDTNSEDIKKFTAQYTWGPGFVILWDPAFHVANRFGTRKIPETYIVDGHHRLLRKVISEQNWTGTEFLNLVDSMLKGASK